MLLKADTGANVNLMNRQTFNQLFGEAKVLQLTPIRHSISGIADDMIIYGRTEQEHDQHLVNFLEVCRKKHIDFESRQDAVQTSTSFLL